MRNESTIKIAPMVKVEIDNNNPVVFTKDDYEIFRYALEKISFTAAQLGEDMDNAVSANGFSHHSIEVQTGWLNRMLWNGIELAYVFASPRLYIDLFLFLQTNDGWRCINAVMIKKGYRWDPDTRTFSI